MNTHAADKGMVQTTEIKSNSQVTGGSVPVTQVLYLRVPQ